MKDERRRVGAGRFAVNCGGSSWTEPAWDMQFSTPDTRGYQGGIITSILIFVTHRFFQEISCHPSDISRAHDQGAFSNDT